MSRNLTTISPFPEWLEKMFNKHLEQEIKGEHTMPLKKSKSKKAFSDNVAAEMDAGKKKDQALAIAYSVKRQAGKKKKK